MPSEAGDMKLLGNYRKLIDLLLAEPTYAPPNSKITIVALEAHYSASMGAAQNVPIRMGPNKVAITERQLAFDRLPEMVMRPHNVVKASGAAQEVVADLDTSKRKTLGRRKSGKVKDDPSTPQKEANATHSALQTSYENQVGNYRAFLAILAAIAEYKPNDPSLKLPALLAFADELQAKNDGASSTFVPLNQARGVRDRLLYLDDDSVVNRALLVKAYIAGEFGTSSAIYKAVKGLEFKRARQR